MGKIGIFWENTMSAKLIIFDSQQNKFEVEIEEFIRVLQQSLFIKKDVIIQFPTPKQTFHFPHPDPIGSIIVFGSKINFPFAPAYSVFPFMWAKAFYELGYSIYLLPQPETQQDVKEAQEFVNHCTPTMIFRPVAGVEYKHCPLVVTITEIPLWEGGSISLQDLVKCKGKDNLFIFCIEKSWVGICKKLGIKNVYFIPHFAPWEICYHTHSLPKIYPICFVGNFAKPQNIPQVDMFIKKHFEHKNNSFDYPMIENLLLELVFHHPWNKIAEICSCLGFKCEGMRYFIISNLIQKYKLTLFGWNVPLEIISHPNVDYKGPAMWLHLPAIFGMSVINLNLHRVVYDYSTQERTFMLIFSKNFFLTDCKELFKTYFPEVYKEICFKNLKELQNKIDYYLKHDHERQEIVKYLFQIAISKHTMQHRAIEILEALNLPYKEISHEAN